MTEEIKCKTCDRIFKEIDGLAAHNKAKHPEISEKKNPLPVKKIKNLGIAIIIVGLIIAGIAWSVSNIKTLPPTDIQGHVESNPPSHILKEPMPIAIQKHMLEHSDGTGKPGIVINYNCEDYFCENDLIEKLENFARDYNYVYVSPFKGMDAKIALTKLNKIEILEGYSEDKIRNFIS